MSFCTRRLLELVTLRAEVVCQSLFKKLLQACRRFLGLQSLRRKRQAVTVVKMARVRVGLAS